MYSNYTVWDKNLTAIKFYGLSLLFRQKDFNFIEESVTTLIVAGLAFRRHSSYTDLILQSCH